MKIVLLCFFLYFAVFSLGQLTRLPLGSSEINFHLADMAVGLLMVSWVIYKIVKKEKILLPPLSNQIFLFFLLALISLISNSSFGAFALFRKGTLLSGRELLVSWLYLARWIFYAGFYFVAYDLVKKNLVFTGKLTKILIAAGSIAALLGLAQYVFLPDTRFIESSGWDPHYFRLIGPFLDPGYMGIILVLTILLVAYSYLSCENKRTRRKWLFLGIFIYIAMVLTYSRASYLAYLGGMAIIAYSQKSPKFFLAILGVFIITIFLLPRPGGEGVRLERQSTAGFRIINWQQSLSIAKDNLLFGVGFNAYRYRQRDYGFLESSNWRASHAGGGADSSVLFVLATTGILGMLSFFWIWLKAILISRKAHNFIALSAIVALLVHSSFANSLFYPWAMSLYWIILSQIEVKG